jgi:2-keto-4-pentenoate hydratase/2-oxohepta-3-ene-1,7-dioic acid hydratase in catechol pathway
MKLIRFGDPGEERPGVLLENGRMVDASTVADDYDEAFFAGGGLDLLDAWMPVHASTAPTIPAGVRLGAPIARPSKIVCIGLNYADHARESGVQPPSEPVIFFKATSAIVGPNDDLVIPKDSQKTDWEVELAVVIGKRASHVTREDADDYIAGYMLHNDYSEREFQLERGGQWVKGKSCDTFAPLGPYLVTKDEIEAVDRLGMWLTVNGDYKQQGNTANMIFDVPTLVSYLSRFMTLLPGDVISTGTPAGVGLGFKPPQFLKPGDVVELGIDSLGRSRQRAVAFSR